MSRKKIFEHKAKELIFDTLDTPYAGLIVTSDNKTNVVDSLSSDKKYVLKVDQGVKGRMKKGLVKLDLSKDDIDKAVEELTQAGYTRFILEEMVDIPQGEERYLSLERTRDGIKIMYAKEGGIEIESNKNVQKVFVEDENDSNIETIELPQEELKKIIRAFNSSHVSFLEINPLIVKDAKLLILDSALEVDSAGEFFASERWGEDDFAVHNIETLTDEEKSVDTLSKKSQASFNLTVLNRNGSIFLLLSGGGASIVVADEAAALGYGKEIANYGEYSGNPSEEETYIYTKNLLSLLLKSTAPKKVLIIAGGVANFTDVRITFRGIIRALNEVKGELAVQGVKVFVRRGGPNQKEGLRSIREFLENNDLLGEVAGPEMVLTNIVGKAIESVK